MLEVKDNFDCDVTNAAHHLGEMICTKIGMPHVTWDGQGWEIADALEQGKITQEQAKVYKEVFEAMCGLWNIYEESK